MTSSALIISHGAALVTLLVCGSVIKDFALNEEMVVGYPMKKLAYPPRTKTEKFERITWFLICCIVSLFLLVVLFAGWLPRMW